MKLAHYMMRAEELRIQDKAEYGRVGLVKGDQIVDIAFAGEWLATMGHHSFPSPLSPEIGAWFAQEESAWMVLKEMDALLEGEDLSQMKFAGENVAVSQHEVVLLPPVPFSKWQGVSILGSGEILYVSSRAKRGRVTCSLVGVRGSKCSPGFCLLSRIQTDDDQTLISLGPFLLSWDEWNKAGSDLAWRMQVNGQEMDRGHIKTSHDEKRLSIQNLETTSRSDLFSISLLGETAFLLSKAHVQEVRFEVKEWGVLQSIIRQKQDLSS